MDENDRRSIEESVSALCEILLIQKDYIDAADLIVFLKELPEKCRLLFSGNSEEVRNVVRITTLNHIRTYIQNASNPFEFDVSYEFVDKQIIFSKEYEKLYPSACPLNLLYVFELIRNASESYSIFEQAYSDKHNEILQRIGQIVIDKTLETIKKDKTVDEKIKSTLQSTLRHAVNKLFEETQKAKNTVTEKASEVSVSILGIFSAIVLVANTFLAFSDITIENFVNASPYRAIFVILVSSFVIGNILLLLISLLFSKTTTTTPRGIKCLKNKYDVTFLKKPQR